MHALEPTPAPPRDDPRLRRFEDLYRGEFAFVWSAAQHLGVPAGVLDEVVQDVFLTAFRRLDHLRYEVSPRAWLFGVTRRVAFRYRRGATRRARRLAGFAELPAPAQHAPQQRHDAARQLAQLLGRLSDGTRVVWELTELLGMSAPEIASELGLPLNTVYSRLRLARRQLQDLVAAPEQLDAWRDAARREQAPPRAAQQRSWALLLPALTDAGRTAGVVAWMKSQVGLATVWITVSAAAVAATLGGASAPPPPATAPPPPAAPARAAPIAAPAPAPTPAPAPAPHLASRTGASDARLAAEIRLIDRAHAELAADPAAALLTIAEHARRFPAGTLVDVRDAARVDALCATGDAAAAEAAARRLLADHPASAVAQRFENYRCPR